jgi:hypothetical protein
MDSLTSIHSSNSSNSSNLDKDIDIILRQTDYSKEVAMQKLELHNNNAINVIKEYMGIKPTEKKTPLKSLNQEIYKQIRTKLDTSMREYREQNKGNLLG